MNSHYIPQFILKGFCNDNKQLIYCDLDDKTVSSRNPRSVFSEEGYYPDQLEKDLCVKIEHAFANLYHNKLENPKSRISLTPEELFTIKKYLIVSAIRHKYELTVAEEEFLKGVPDGLKSLFNADHNYIESLNHVLGFDNQDELFDYLNNRMNTLSSFGDIENSNEMYLWAEMRQIVYNYLVFVRAGENEEFLINDIGRAVFEGPMSIRKLNATLDTVAHNPLLYRVALMITPRDYSFYPITKKLAIITFDVFYKMLTESEIQMNVILPKEYPTVDSFLGFGSRQTLSPPKVMNNYGSKEYRYELKRLTSVDVAFLNSLLIHQSYRFIACSDLSKIQESVNTAKNKSKRDLSFLVI